MNQSLIARGQCVGALILVCALLASCSVPSSSSRLYRKADSSVPVASATPATQPQPTTASTPASPATNVVWDSSVFRNSVSTERTIRQAPAGTDKSGADVFAIYLNDGYFKYLKDWGGVNEVVVVAQFTETETGGESDTVTRILGPYSGVADKADFPSQGQLLYGFKNLDADHLHMKLTVLEYDQGENANSAAFLEFIKSVSKTLSLANPVTASEVAFAKEIATSLLSLNHDDVAMRVDINFTANAGDLAKQKYNGSFIPLDVGDYIVISKEHCVPANCFFQLTNEGTSYNPFAWVGDIALLVPTAMRRAWTDTPDGPALSEIDRDSLTYDNHMLGQTTTADKVGTPYTDKSWLSLSIVRGGSAALWQKRKALSQAEQSIQNLLKVRGEGITLSQNYSTVQKALEQAQQLEALNSSGVSFVLPLDDQGTFAPTTSTGEYCLVHARTLTGIAASFYRLDSKDVPQALPADDIAVNTKKSTPNNTCFTVGNGGRAIGTYDMVAVYKVGTDLMTQRVRYKIEK